MKDPRRLDLLLSNLIAGLTSGLVAVVYSISFAALIFSEKLTPFFPQGVGTALVGATVTAIMVAWRSPFPFTIAGPEANSAIILALAARSIANAFPSDAAGLYPTVWAAIVISTLVNGLFLHLLGWFRLGQLARYVPYPVVGGFLAGTGCLIARSSVKVMTGIPLSLAELPHLLQPNIAVQWIAGLGVAALLVLLLARFRHFLVLPVFLVSGIALSNGARILIQQRHFDAKGWFFESFSSSGVWQSWQVPTITNIDWSVLGHQSGLLLATLAIVTLSILLNSTGLELATGRNVDLNAELQANGMANLVNGFCGGMIGYTSVNRCLLNQRAGATAPLAGMVAGAFCGSILLFGSALLSYVPKPLLGGLLLYIGWNLIVRWVYRSWTLLPRFDYGLVVLILVIIVTVGFIAGIASGIVIACLLFIVSYGRTSSVKYSLSGQTYRSNVVRSAAQQHVLQAEGDSIAIMVLQGFLFFGTANDLLDRTRSRLEQSTRPRLTFAVFDFRLVTGLDSSAVLSFIKLGQIAAKTGLRLVFAHLSSNIETQLRLGGMQERSAAGYQAFPDVDRAMEWCENQTLQSRNLLETPSVPLENQLHSIFNDENCARSLIPYLLRVDLLEGQYLCRQGEPSESLYFLESGRVSVVLEARDGSLLRRRTYTSGTILGEMGFYSGGARSATVLAEQPSTLYELRRDAFRALEQHAPLTVARFNQGVVNLVASRLRRSEEEVKELLL